MHREGKWARQLIALQQEDGSWGQFHSMSTYSNAPFTTEQALMRLKRFGFTIEDECIRRAVAYMADCLDGRNEIPDPREKLHNWDIFTSLMLAARIREFEPENALAMRTAKRWAGIITCAFGSGDYDHARYIEAYCTEFGMKPRGGRLVDFANFYPLSLLQDMLDPQTEDAMMKYVLSKPDGIYYVYDRPLMQPPDFKSRNASRYLGTMEILAGYRHAQKQLGFVAEWIEANRSGDGSWDMGSTVRDGMYFPLSDDWRRRERRIADCTERISRLLARITQCVL